jgi:hypothetical protein
MEKELAADNLSPRVTVMSFRAPTHLARACGLEKRAFRSQLWGDRGRPRGEFGSIWNGLGRRFREEIAGSGAMKYFGPNVRLRWIVVAAFLSTGVLASARADQVVLGGPGSKDALESQDALDVTFLVNNTGLPDKVAVKIGQITEAVAPNSGDTDRDVLTDGSIIGTTCGTLAVKKTCDVLARYDILDGDPFDLDKTADRGVWFAKIEVSWTTIDGMHSGTAFGHTVGIVHDPRARLAIPEPSTWVELLVGFSALGFAGYFRVRSRQALTSA